MVRGSHTFLKMLTTEGFWLGLWRGTVFRLFFSTPLGSSGVGKNKQER